MAPTLNPVVLDSHLAERWFARPERMQSSQPLEGSSFIIHEFDPSPFTRHTVYSRSASDASTSSSHSTAPTGAIAGVIGGAVFVTLCVWFRKASERLSLINAS